MGCGGSKENYVEGELPIDNFMEKIGDEQVDGVFERCANLISQVEEKRKFLFDELNDNYYHTGAYVYRNPTPLNAIECSVWRLGVDNKGVIANVGINLESMQFEGAENSEKGNMVANNFTNYMKCITQEMKMEDLNSIHEHLTECVNEINANFENNKQTIEKNPKLAKGNSLSVMNSVAKLKCNQAKANRALSICKAVCNRYKELHEGASAVMEFFNLEKIAAHQPHVENAVKSKQTENLAIAFAVVSPIHRREKTLKAVFASYQEKNKVRTAAYEKIARASHVKTQAENPKQEAAQVQPENEQVQE